MNIQASSLSATTTPDTVAYALPAGPYRLLRGVQVGNLLADLLHETRRQVQEGSDAMVSHGAFQVEGTDAGASFFDYEESDSLVLVQEAVYRSWREEGLLLQEASTSMAHPGGLVTVPVPPFTYHEGLRRSTARLETSAGATTLPLA